MKKFIISIMLIITLVLSSLVFTGCEKKPELVFVEKDIDFYVDVNNSNIMGFAFLLFIDENSKITLRKDGTATVLIKSKNYLNTIAGFVLNSDAVSEFDLSAINDMAKEYFPGFSFKDMEKSLELIKKSIGVNIEGFDFDDPDTIAMFNEINNTNKLPADLKLPKSLLFEYNAGYYLMDVETEKEGKMTGVYMGKHEENGEPYMMMTKTFNEDTHKNEIRLYNKMLNLEIIGKEN